jgi:hypothetical protein
MVLLSLAISVEAFAFVPLHYVARIDWSSDYLTSERQPAALVGLTEDADRSWACNLQEPQQGILRGSIRDPRLLPVPGQQLVQPSSRPCHGNSGKATPGRSALFPLA